MELGQILKRINLGESNKMEPRRNNRRGNTYPRELYQPATDDESEEEQVSVSKNKAREQKLESEEDIKRTKKSTKPKAGSKNSDKKKTLKFNGGI